MEMTVSKTGKASKTFIFFIAATAVCIVVRYMQLVSAIDYETGFYLNHTGILGSLLYIVFGIGLLGLIAFSFIDKKNKSFFSIKKVGVIDKTESTIIAFMFLLLGIVMIIGIATGDTENGLNANYIVLATGGTAGFILTGLAIFLKKRITSLSGYLLLFPCIYYSIRAVLTFMEHLVITRMSEYLVVLLIDICLVFFYLGAGRIFSRNEGKFTRVRFAVTGYAACALIFSETISKVLFWLTTSDVMRDNLSSTGNKFIMPDMKSMAEGIIIITILFIFQKKPFKNNNELLTEEIQPEKEAEHESEN